MKHLLSPVLQAFVAKHSFVILLVLFLAWMCIGIFPLHCYESDSMHTIAGCYTLLNQGFTIPPIYSYEYHMQPLIYYLVAGMSYLFSFLSCEEMFCLLTGIAAILTILVSIRFVYRITGIRREYILFALFLLPESVAIGMYPNTAIFAMLPFMLALNYFLSRRLIPAIAWMCLAPLFRIDILMVYPVILFIFLWQKDTFITALKKSLLSAVIIVAVLVVCYWGLQANPLDSTLKGYEEWNGRVGIPEHIYAILTFYTALGFLLFPLGIYRMFKQKQWYLLLLILVPVLLNHFVYRKMGCATKHYLYILPFVASAVGVALTFLVEWLRNKIVLRYLFVAFLLIFLLGSIRLDLPGRPWRDMSQSEAHTGPCLTLRRFSVGSYGVSIGLGAGFIVSSADEKMLMSGNLFYPLCIHNIKKARMQVRQLAFEYLSDKGNYSLLGLDWESIIYLPLLLQAEGYSFVPETDCYVLQNGGHTVTVLRKSLTESENKLPTEERIEVIRNLLHHLPIQESPLFFCVKIDGMNYFFDQLAKERLAKKVSDGLYVLYLQKN